MKSSHPTSDIAAARLAILVLRAALGGEVPTTYRLSECDTPLSYSEAVEHLAALPKPLQYKGAIAGSETRLDIDTIVNERRIAIRADQREPFAFLRKRHGVAIETLEVACCSGADHLRVTVADFRSWTRDYYLALPHSYGSDLVSSSYARAHAAMLDLRGAAATAFFGSGSGTRLIVHSCS
jgi:hypothetical protein